MRIFCFLITFFVCVPSLANPYRLPQGERVMINNEIYNAYTLEEMKILLKMDVDLKALVEKDLLSEELIKKSEEQKINLQIQLQSKQKQIELIEAERRRLLQKWVTENQLRHACEQKPAYGSWVAWSIAGAGVVSTVALVLVLSFQTR